VEIGNRLVATGDKVEIRLTGILSRYSPAGELVEVEAGQQIRNLAGNLGIPTNQPFVAVVNGRTCDLGYCLKAGDEVRLVPTIGGGGY
jgi:sulfur carrier protein ThiS